MYLCFDPNNSESYIIEYSCQLYNENKCCSNPTISNAVTCYAIFVLKNQLNRHSNKN